MAVGCLTQATFTSGDAFTGLAQNTTYFVQVIADASTGYLSSTGTHSASAVRATVQLNAMAAPTIVTGTATGDLKVTFTGPTNKPAGQTYSAFACTNAGMTTGCVTQASIVSGGTNNFTGLVSGTSVKAF